MHAVIETILSQPGVAGVYRAEDLDVGDKSLFQTKTAFTEGYFSGRSGDLFVVPKPYWILDGTKVGEPRDYGTSHGTPYNYDQRVPVLLMGFGIRQGEYLDAATPADVAPTLAALTGVTLATRDGRVLAEALRK